MEKRTRPGRARALPGHASAEEYKHRPRACLRSSTASAGPPSAGSLTTSGASDLGRDLCMFYAFVPTPVEVKPQVIKKTQPHERQMQRDADVVTRETLT
jgi:hypothetical protein